MKRIHILLFAIIAMFISGCSNSGNQFVGKWSCTNNVLGTITMSIRNNGGDNYIIDNYPMIGKVNVTYKDGKLNGPQGMAFTIDKQSGKLIGMNICEMTRVK